jgi:tetratricopeptide (TPR) repeat protein
LSPEHEQSPSNNPVATLHATFQRAVASHQQGQLAEAERLYQEVLHAQPNSFSALYMLGLVAFQSRVPQRGVELTSRAIALNPSVAEAHNNLANGLVELARPEEALASFDKAIALKPDYFEAHNNRVAALNQLGRFAEALQSCDRAIALRPDYAEAHYNRGIALQALAQPEQALASYDRAIALRPDFPEVYNNRGVVLDALDRHAEALASFDRSLALWPEYADAYTNRGATLTDLGRHEEALASYDKAIALRPEHVETHLNRGLLLLLLGRFAQGWREFEWRKRLPEALGARSFPRPLWTGAEDIRGQTLLVHAEQGFGDTLHFCRYAKLLEARGTAVIFSVRASLQKLLASLSPTIRVVVDGELPPTFDYHCPLLSLPLAFGTTLETIPAQTPYLFADKGLTAEWSALLPAKTKPRIGIVWSGNPDQGNDRNRSMALETFLPLVGDEADWIALQIDVRERDSAALRRNGRIAFFGDAIKDFSDTAAVLDLMDLVITVDTSVAHLAGAMGKPVWILLAYNADWRYLLERSDCPWYPSARLFRQRTLGEWDAVIAAVKSELAAFLRSR